MPPAGRRAGDRAAGQRAARQSVEARYDAATFATHLHEAERLVVLGLRLAELDGLPAREPAVADAIERRAVELVEDLVEPARTTALDKLDENRQALAIATTWLRRKSDRARVTDGETPTL